MSDTPTPSSPTNTHILPEDRKEENAGDTRSAAQRPQQFTSEKAREAARLRWAKRRTDEAEQVQTAENSDIVVRTSVGVSKIIKRLSADAEKGSTNAARELRTWLNEVVVETNTSVSDLDRKTRQSLLARLLLEIDQEMALVESEVESEAGMAAVSEEATPVDVGTPSSIVA